MPVTISVIVPVYNKAASLAACMDSLFCQSLPVKEVIVVDDQLMVLCRLLNGMRQIRVFISFRRPMPVFRRRATGDWLQRLVNMFCLWTGMICWIRRRFPSGLRFWSRSGMILSAAGTGWLPIEQRWKKKSRQNKNWRDTVFWKHVFGTRRLRIMCGLTVTGENSCRGLPLMSVMVRMKTGNSTFAVL